MSELFGTVLVANRGEIAVRVMRTLRDLDVRSVAVYTAADRGALHVASADIAIEIGSYLSVDDVIAAGTTAGAAAIHPGYGFLSENPALARACADAGVVFVGPPASAIDAMGDKIAAKATVAAAGVSVVPGSDGAGLSDEALAVAARQVGFPVLLKPSAGGGGKGMRLVHADDELGPAIESARREARTSFGDDTLLVERFVTNPRHIEIQVLADTHGNVVHLGERECSLQRRHQKIVEEAPSPLLTATQRDAMGAQAVEAARACGYVGAGTVEFIVSSDQPDDFFFMEMNTRLQVEHPVTELVYGLDLVALQLQVAAGERLPFTQAELQMTGHAVEVRVYAEDPSRGFLPTGGTVELFAVPDVPGVRVDSGIESGSVVGSSFDPMLAKVIAWGEDRSQALARLDRALAGTSVLGVTTNIAFLRRLLSDASVRAGDLDTGLVERELDALVAPDEASKRVALVAAAVVPLSTNASDRANDPWAGLVGWRLNGPSDTRRAFIAGGDMIEVQVRRHDDGAWHVRSEDVADATVTAVEMAGDQVSLVVDGARHDVAFLERSGSVLVGVGGGSWSFAELVDRGDGGGMALGGDAIVRSPMPGTVVSISVAAGDSVTAGQVVAVVKAMKMEHALTAPFDGVIETVHASAGAQVSLDQPLVTLETGDD